MFPCKKHSSSTKRFDIRSIINKKYCATFFFAQKPSFATPSLKLEVCINQKDLLYKILYTYVNLGFKR